MHHAVVHERTIGYREPGPVVAPSPVAVIARGGMGYVELCWMGDQAGGRWVARKRLHVQFRDDPQYRAMFIDEARVARLVQHPNVVSAFEVGEDDDGPYLVMDYVAGISLSRLVRRVARARRRIPMGVAASICREVALGLHAAHEACAEDGSPLNLVHRDVSPQNVLIGFDGSVRVTDFGIAKALGNENQTVAGVLKGNMGYLAPEQLRFHQADRRSDLFSLGVTLFELLNGGRLYPNRTGFEGTRRILNEPPPDVRRARPEVPPALAHLLLEMLSKRITGRPATAMEVAVRLEAILTDLAALEPPLSLAEYVGQNLAGERERHRRIVAEYRERAELRALATAAGAAPDRPGPRAPRWWVVALFLVSLVGATAAVARVRRQPDASPAPEAPPATGTSTSPPIEIVPLPAPAAAPQPPPPVAVPAAPPPAAQRRPSHPSKKGRHGRKS